MHSQPRLNPVLILTLVLSLLITPWSPLLHAQEGISTWLPLIGNGVTVRDSDLLFRTRVEARTPAMWTALEQMNPLILERGEDWALLLVDDEGLESLARRRFNPTATDSIESLVNYNGHRDPIVTSLGALLAQASDVRAQLDGPVAADVEAATALRTDLRSTLHTLDGRQRGFFLAANSADNDNDGLTDTEERWWCTNPNSADSNENGVSDGDSVKGLVEWMNNERSGPPPSGRPFRGWPMVVGRAEYNPDCIDGDFDAVPDLAESRVLGLNPNRESTTGDKFDDGQKLFGLTYCPGSGAFCGYGVLPRNEDWGTITANMPSWVKAPGNHPLVAAYPVPEVDVVASSLKVETVTTVTTDYTISEGTEKSYSTSKTEGTSSTVTNTETWNEWIEVSESLSERALVTTRASDDINWSWGQTGKLALGSAQIVGGALGAFAGCGIGAFGAAVTGGLGTPLGIAVCAGSIAAAGAAAYEGGLNIRDAFWPDEMQSATGSNTYKSTDQRLAQSTGQQGESAANSTVLQIQGNETNNVIPSYAGTNLDIQETKIDNQILYDIRSMLAQPVRTRTESSGHSWGGSRSTAHTSYEEHTVTNGEAFSSSESWSTATAINSAHAADLWFTYKVRNTGTEYAREIGNLAFNVYIGEDPNPAITYFVAPDLGGSGKFQNFMPGEEHTFTSRRIPLSLEQMKAIDLGGPLRIVVEDFSYGVDELFYQNAANSGLIIAIEDGTDDGDEAIDTYLIPTWGQETVLDVLARYFPHETDSNGMMTAIWTPEYNRNTTPGWCLEPRRPKDFPNRVLWCKRVLSTAEWWNVYTDGLGDGSEGFQDTAATPGGVALFRFNKDTDRDGFSDRTEKALGTEPNDPTSFPRPEVLAGLHCGSPANNSVTCTLSLLNTGPYDAYGVEAVMVAPDDSISITNNTVGGSGRVRALKEVVVGSRLLLPSPLPAAWTQTDHAVPAVGGYYTGSSDRIYTFTVANCGAGGCNVGAGSWTLNWNDGQGNSGSLNFANGYKSPLFLPVGNLGLTLALYSGKVNNGESFTVSALTPRDTFKYTINRQPHTPPLVIVSYNDPQGNHRFIIPDKAIKLSAPTEPLQQFAGEMLDHVGVEVVTQSPFTPGSNNVSLLVNLPVGTPVKAARLFLEFIDPDGKVVLEVPTQTDLNPGPNFVTVNFNSGSFSPAYDQNKDYIVLAFLTDYQGNILDTAGRPLSSFQKDPLPQMVGALPVTWNFGTVEKGALLKHQLPLANTGFGRLYTYVNPATGLYLARPGGTTGAADLLDAVLTLRTGELYEGAYDQTLYLATSDPGRPSLPVRVVGTIAPATGDTAASGILRPLDVAVTVQAPKNAGEWVDFTHNLGPSPSTLHPVKVYNSNYSTLHGVGAVATDFGEGTASAEMFGDGRDGDITISTDTTFNSPRTPLSSTAAAGQSILHLGNASGFDIGDEVLIIQIQGTGAGYYEFGRIVSKSGNQLTLAKLLQNTYTQAGASKAQVVRVPNYRNVTITSSGRWRAPAWDGNTGGILVLKVSGMTYVESGGLIDASGKGFRGAPTSTADTGRQGEGQINGNFSISHSSNGMGGGGGWGTPTNTNRAAAGGGGGGHATTGINGKDQLASEPGGAGGGTFGLADLSRAGFGGGGGAGGAGRWDVDLGGAGGAGGGFIVVYARMVDVSQATVLSNGASGASNSGGVGDGGGGGGGAGGSILIKTQTTALGENKVNAIGGSGGAAPGPGSIGGAGGQGRLRLEYCNTISGTTNPAASTQKLDCYIAEQTGSSTGRLNLPETIASNTTYRVQYGRKLDYAAAGAQTTTLRIPAGHLTSGTFNLLASGVGSGNVTVQVDIGNNGVWDWQSTLSVQNSATFTSTNLAAALNAYWASQGSPLTGNLDVPVKISLSKPGQLLATNLQVRRSASLVRGVQLPAASYNQFLLDFTVGGIGTENLSVAIDVGDNGSIDWSSSGAQSFPHRYLTGNLAGAINSYLSGKSGAVTVPIRIFVSANRSVMLNDYTASSIAAANVDFSATNLTVGTAARSGGPKEGDILTVNATLRNTGSAQSGPVTAAFFATAEGWGDWYIGSVFVDKIPAGDSVPASIQWNTTGFGGNVPVKVVINPYGRVNEASLSNNTATSTVAIISSEPPTPITPTVTPTPTPTSVTVTPTPTATPTATLVPGATPSIYLPMLQR